VGFIVTGLKPVLVLMKNSSEATA